MKLGIMQPYFFPYIGYFQYIAASDKFIFYDDVAFIMRGWINRNYIRLHHKKHLITVPLANASPNRTIREVEIAMTQEWQGKILTILRQAYAKAPGFENVFPLIETLFKAEYSGIAELAKASIRLVCSYLDLAIDFVDSAEVYNNSHLKREQRVIDILKNENFPACIVPLGGKDLYDKDYFKNHGIDLFYIKPVIEEYSQQAREFLPSLSIIDVLMFNDKNACREMIRKHELL
jgi:hypothetical protein